MPTLLVKNVPEDLMRELKKLKVELGCKTWVKLLDKLVKRRRVIVVEEAERTRGAVEEFLALREIVTAKWGEGSVLEEFGRVRSHEAEATGS